MNAPTSFAASDENPAFGADARAKFASNYPEGPHKLRHSLAQNELLTLESLAVLGETLPASSVEYNRGDLPIGVTGKPAASTLTIGETIRNAPSSNSWAVLKNIEQQPEYAALLASLLDEIRPEIESKTGPMLLTQGFIFVSSPNAVTPYHFDPEHNILLQLVGTKVMTQFPAGHDRYAPDTLHESYHTGGARELVWRDDMMRGGKEFSLESGDAVYVPVMAPHFVRNGPSHSISLSITWRSQWSYAEADARAFNAILRAKGVIPKPPGRWPSSNRAKSLVMRVLRRLGHKF